VAANVLAHGTGALNIDGCRVGSESTARIQGEAEIGFHGGNFAPGLETGSTLGRWPANLIHDGSEEVLVGFPESKSGGYPPEGGQRSQVSTYGKPTARGEQKFTASTGSAARFFYCAKASKADRDAGLDHMEAVHRVNGNKWTDQDYRVTNGERPPSAESGPRKNVHPTVKPTDLMAYLCRLVTPAGGVVLDPFMGSGSTGKAAMREGMRFIGCEMSPEYMAIAQARIEHELALVTAASAPAPQSDLFGT